MHANGPRITQHPRRCQTPIKAHGSQLDKSIHVSEADVCVNMTSSDEVNWKQLLVRHRLTNGNSLIGYWHFSVAALSIIYVVQEEPLTGIPVGVCVCHTADLPPWGLKGPLV